MLSINRTDFTAKTQRTQRKNKKEYKAYQIITYLCELCTFAVKYFSERSKKERVQKVPGELCCQ